VAGAWRGTCKLRCKDCSRSVPIENIRVTRQSLPITVKVWPDASEVLLPRIVLQSRFSVVTLRADGGGAEGNCKLVRFPLRGVSCVARRVRQVHPVCSELLDSLTCQGRRSCSERSPRILTEVGDRNLPEIDLSECHGASAHGRLRCAIDGTNEHTHPLIPGPVSVHCPSRFSGRLDLDSVRSRPDTCPSGRRHELQDQDGR